MKYFVTFQKPPNKARHDKLVERMLELHKRQSPHRPSDTSPREASCKGKFQNAEFRGGGRTPQEQEMLKREIEPAADRALDRCVYELSPEGDDIWVE